MRLLNFLNEDAGAANKVEKQIKRDECIKILKEKCSNNIKKNNIYIYRGAYSDKDCLLFDGTKKRKSANTYNHYTILFSELLDSWKGIPKRDHSLICGVSINFVSNFGDNVYRIIPFDDTKIAYTESDIWFSLENNSDFSKMGVFDFEGLTTDLYHMGIKDTSAYLKKHILLKLSDIEKNKDKEIFNFYFSLACLYKKISVKQYYNSPMLSVKDSYNNELYDEYKKIYDKNIKTFKDMTIKEILEYHLSPKKLKVKVIDYNKVKSISQYSEVWMDKPAVLIREDIFDDVVDELNSK